MVVQNYRYRFFLDRQDMQYPQTNPTVDPDQQTPYKKVRIYPDVSPLSIEPTKLEEDVQVQSVEIRSRP